MFELLFNYPLVLWQQATLVFDSGLPPWALGVASAVVLLLIAASLWRRPLSAGRRTLVGLLQGVAAVVALTMIWQPALQVSISERGENTVAWVLDTSRSMELADVDADVVIPGMAQQAESRRDAGLEVIRRLALGEDQDFTPALYALDGTLTSAADLESLAAHTPDARTAIAAGLDDLLGTVNESALAAVVLISDGADNSDRIDTAWWQSLQSAGVPVHTVGVGQSRLPDDLELSDVTLPDSAQPDTEVMARLRISHGQGGGVARLRVTAGSELLAAEDIDLPSGVEQSVHSLSFGTGESGIRRLEFSLDWSLPADAGELRVDPMPANNRQPRLLEVIDDPRRILYVEGEPRWEYKFLRRALEAHPGVSIVSLLRTSPNKFYRQGVENAAELEGGFPLTREQLFRYDAVIIGSFEAAELSTSQQSALRDFVSQRGGSLLMLGGQHGLADGGWGRSVVASALPVQLGSRLDADTFERRRTYAMPTLSGLRTPWLQLADDDQANIDAWRGLPELADVQSVGQAKPGAVVLLEHTPGQAGGRSPEPLLVQQRYGRGQSIVFGTSGTWRWQMSLPSEDMRHERFWRQFLGMVVEQSVPRLAIETASPVYRDTDTAELSVVGYDADYSNLQASVLPVTLTGPDGSVQSLSLYPDSEQPGRYTGRIPMNSDGPYALLTTTPLDGESPALPPVSAERWWVRESGNAEAYGAGLQAAFLQRISETTGGSYLALDDVDRLADVLATENAALKRENRLPLWNMPFFFLCLILAKAIEWALRLRWKRL